MELKMNITQAEKLTGVSKRNIRFYEKEGLLQPEHDKGNGYRKYDESEIWKIQVIKMLRMLDMPLEEIRAVLNEELTLEQAIIVQQIRLEEKQKELQEAIWFCNYLKTKDIHEIDVERCMSAINSNNKNGFFMGWMDDYKTVKKENRDRDFSFTPDEPIYNAREFTNALFQYANENHLELIITKESMYPEFTIDGIEYTAERNFYCAGVFPLATISCHRVDREIKGDGISKGKKRVLWFLQKYWLVMIFLLIDFAVILWNALKKSGFEDWVLVISISSIIGICLYRFYYFRYNTK